MSQPLNDDQRLLLDKMIKANDAEDNTNKIRNLKHSGPIEQDIRTYVSLCARYGNMKFKQAELFKTMCENRCSFLFRNYTHIFTKLLKDELDLNIMHKFISVLREIEEGKTDQHEGSIKIGTILKELYIDSALKQEQNYNKKNAKRNTNKKFNGKSIRQRNNANYRKQNNTSSNLEITKQEMSWKDYKKNINMDIMD